jgi:hypothetical protein
MPAANQANDDAQRVISDGKDMVPLDGTKGALNLVSSKQYFYNKSNDTYYTRVSEFGDNSPFIRVPPGSNVDKQLRKEYPRGTNEIQADFNPQLETKTTITTKFAGAGVAPEGAAGSVRFPSDMLIDEGEDFVMFDFYDYKPPFQDKRTPDGDIVNQTLEQYNATGFSSEYFKMKEFPQIIMYMPQDVQDKFSAKWEGKKFGAITTGLIAAAGQGGGAAEKLKGLAKTKNAAIDKAGVEAAAAVVTKLASSITGDNITAGDLFAGISGVVRNPNVEVLFQNMELRTFDLTFKMAPYSETDVQSMDAIIKIFKQAMLPQYRLGKSDKVFGQDAEKGGLQGGFIKVPRVCSVNFMRGGRRNRFLPRYKMCAITDVGVNYTPDGTYATFDRSSPVATEIKISFMETKLVFSEDISERGF